MNQENKTAKHEFSQYMNIDLNSIRKRINSSKFFSFIYCITSVSFLYSLILSLLVDNFINKSPEYLISISNDPGSPTFYVMCGSAILTSIFYFSIILPTIKFISNKSKNMKNINIEFSRLTKDELSIIINTFIKCQYKKENGYEAEYISPSKKPQHLKEINDFFEKIKNKNITYNDLRFFNEHDHYILEVMKEYKNRENYYLNSDNQSILTNLSKIEVNLDEQNLREKNSMVENSLNFNKNI